MESIGEFQAHRKPVESLDDDLLVPSTEFHPEHHISLKEKDFRKCETAEEDFVLPYGWHASIWVSFIHLKLRKFFYLCFSGISFLAAQFPSSFLH